MVFRSRRIESGRLNREKGVTLEGGGEPSKPAEPEIEVQPHSFSSHLTPLSPGTSIKVGYVLTVPSLELLLFTAI